MFEQVMWALSFISDWVAGLDMDLVIRACSDMAEEFEWCRQAALTVLQGMEL